MTGKTGPIHCQLASLEPLLRRAHRRPARQLQVGQDGPPDGNQLPSMKLDIRHYSRSLRPAGRAVEEKALAGPLVPRGLLNIDVFVWRRVLLT